MKNGFTLIETLIYLFILSTILGALLLSVYSIFETSDSVQSTVELVENAKFYEQKTRWALTGATQINSPASSSTAASLSLNRADTANPVVFDLSGGVARIKIGAANPVPLTNGFVTVSSLSFSNYSISTNTKNTVRVRANLRHNNLLHPASTSLDFFISIQ